MTVLVTGGAGYIGSHVALALLQSGEKVVVLDNLSTGSREPVDYLAKYFGHRFSFVHESLDCKPERLRPFLVAKNIESVVHMAASVQVGESVCNPLLYYRNNVVHTQALVEACMGAGVKQFVFSSSAAVYGNPAKSPVPEASMHAPLSPYGRTKAMVEALLQDACAVEHSTPSKRFSCITLRYFNVAGVYPWGKLGYRLDSSPTHLIRRSIAAAMGKLDRLEIFGADYPTPDGTCIRDYVHVCDLADAHVRALAYARHYKTQPTFTFNCGSGQGYSVLDVINTVKQESGATFKVCEAPRRQGDPAYVVADISRIGRALQWRTKYGLDEMIRHQLAWEKSQQ